MFAKESASSSVQTLGPEDFPAKVTKPDHPFFVDFFAPVSEQSQFYWSSFNLAVLNFKENAPLKTEDRNI